MEGGPGSQGISEFGHEDLFEHPPHLLSFRALLDLEGLDGVFFTIHLTLPHTSVPALAQCLPATRDAHRKFEQVDINTVKPVGEGNDAGRLGLLEGRVPKGWLELEQIGEAVVHNFLP